MMAYSDEPPTVEEFDPMGQFVNTVAGDVRDPYPHLARKRRTSPVEIIPVPDFLGEPVDTCVAYTFEHVSQLLRDNQTFSSGLIRDLMGLVMGPYVLVGMDEPEHGRHRQLVGHAFRQKALAHWEADLVGPVVNELIDCFANRGEAELVREFTFHFPVQVIATILGLPRDDHAQFHRWAIDLINVPAQPERGLKASDALRQYLAGIVEERRRSPSDDVISDLVQAEYEGEKLSDEEIFSFLRLLLPAGAETTYRATGNLLYGLLTHPEQLALLRADRSLMPRAIEESVRWETPVVVTSRVAACDTVLGGVEIPAGLPVTANIGSANHDETRWDDAEAFDITRPPKPHIAFGLGPHMCLGMHLARMEMRIAVGSLLDRFPDLSLVTDGDPHIHGERFRSPTSLPVRFTPE